MLRQVILSPDYMAFEEAQAPRLLLLNGFVKKGRADYGRAVQKALGIIRDLL